ncbi:MAG: ACP S-malonyltransferase [Planctomycetes bacterium]|nr:ACP S-malonyltransferase [Planctomycetota bacterium]
MSTILLDEHLGGYAGYLESLTYSDYWREIAEAIELRFVQLDDVGIAAGTSDLVIWRFYQANGLYLLTDNRSESATDSLGTVISAEGTAESLPVFTIGSMNRFRTERDYGEALAKSLLQHLFDRERIRGTGRLFIP